MTTLTHPVASWCDNPERLLRYRLVLQRFVIGDTVWFGDYVIERVGASTYYVHGYDRTYIATSLELVIDFLLHDRDLPYQPTINFWQEMGWEL